MTAPYFKEVFEYPIDEFTRHLFLENNDRIFFSARYGAGKTTFLKDFFGLPTLKEQYEVYHLFPVNYSISASEDIIKYIKYDTIIAMLERGDTFPVESKGYLQTLPPFLLRRVDKVLAAIITMIPEVGKSVLDMYNRIEKLKDEYLAVHEEANAGPSDQLATYLDTLEGQGGSLVENDIITRIIASKIQSNHPKQSVLIMDDLDRLDPAHVFRILNVFAAHFDARNVSAGANKLGFDKVIIVCDINNIRHIFHHQYGLKVDFTGYIDKFYSREVYHFDNRPAVAKIARKIVESYLLPDNKNDIRQIYFHDGFLYEILLVLLGKGIISLRAICNTYAKRLSYHEEEVDVRDHRPVAAWKLPMVSKIKYLTELLGGLDQTIPVLEMFGREAFSIHNVRLYPGDLVYVLHYERLQFKDGMAFVYHKDNKYILEPDHDFSYSSSFIAKVNMYNTNSELDIKKAKDLIYEIPESEYWQLMIDTIKRVQALGYLN